MKSLGRLLNIVYYIVLCNHFPMNNKVLVATTLGLGLMLIIGTLINPNAYAQENHPLVASSYSIPAAESRSILFSISS
jgi:hypothetical protein